MFKINILESEKELKDMIMQCFTDEVNNAIKSSKSTILEQIQHLVIVGLQDTKEYHDLTVGILKVEFGFMIGDEKNIIDAIINRIAKSIEIDIYPFKYKSGHILGHLRINMLQEDFQDILKLPEATTKPQGYGFESIPWLEWYLGRGGQIVIRDYGIQYGVFPVNSRSGFGVMVKDGGPYVVPGDNSPRDNWFTRFFSSILIENKIFEIVEKEITKDI